MFRISCLGFLFCLFLMGPALGGPAAATLDVRAIMASPQFSNSVQLILALGLLSLIPFFLISAY